MKCKTCKSHCAWVGKEESEHGKCLVGYTPQTNADRIRAMTDEELAELFMQEYDGADSFTCPVPHPCPPEKEASCRECFLDWLKEDAD